MLLMLTDKLVVEISLDEQARKCRQSTFHVRSIPKDHTHDHEFDLVDHN